MRWSYEAAHFCPAPVSQSDQCTRVPPRSKMTPRGAVTARTIRNRAKGAASVFDLSWLFWLFILGQFFIPLYQKQMLAVRRDRVPLVRAKAWHPPHLDDPSTGDDVVPRVPHRALHRYRGLRADPSRHQADAARARD